MAMNISELLAELEDVRRRMQAIQSGIADLREQQHDPYKAGELASMEQQCSVMAEGIDYLTGRARRL
jgi:hypothetical protein